ncbi:hypothetical protein HRS9122_09521 [Pyrenophora teres f. teres]|nr:hypothetical protein HRS9122_09521 [Pyrenophora teres f. teres]
MSEREEQLKNAKECANTIRFKTEDGKVHPNQLARVMPNQKLKDIFGIENAFTSLSNKRPFVAKAENLMLEAMNCQKDTPDDWTNLRHGALTYFDEYMNSNGVHSFKLAELTQYLTLKISLRYLFDGAHEALKSDTHFQDVIYIGKRINELWIESKQKDLAERERPLWKDETNLHNALRRVTFSAPNVDIGGYPNDATTADPLEPSNNPMNLLLPAYETMWRVVLRCFLEVQHRAAGNKTIWTAVLRDYLRHLKNPNSIENDVFHKPTEANGSIIRPVEIVKEALRLYPPTRRVHRCFNNKEVKADIEACHRQKILCGDDPNVFRPERWQGLCSNARQAWYDKEGGTIKKLEDLKKLKTKLKTEEEELGFMPFAYYCAADHINTKEFASKMIALLVAVLCNGLGDEWILEDSDSIPPYGIPLSSERGEYEELSLKKAATTK